MAVTMTIDPGKRSIAWALFVESELGACGYSTHNRDFDIGLQDMLQDVQRRLPATPDLVVAELPRVYPEQRGGRPNDLIDLAAVAGACVVFGPLRFVHPAQWKGQVPKKVANDRAVARLSLHEGKVTQQWLDNDHVLDAIGIGLHWVHR